MVPLLHSVRNLTLLHSAHTHKQYNAAYDSTCRPITCIVDARLLQHYLLVAQQQYLCNVMTGYGAYLCIFREQSGVNLVCYTSGSYKYAKQQPSCDV
jgi:hypothetical protein